MANNPFTNVLLWLGFLLAGLAALPGWAQTQALKITQMSAPSGAFILNWTGGTAPYQVQYRASLTANWQNINGPTTGFSQTNAMTGQCGFYRVVSAVGDLTAPTATLTSPSGGSTVSGTIALTANASDNVGVARVEFWCDGSVLLGSASTAPYNIAYSTLSIANGAHTFTCKAYDTAGNSTVSSANSATVNNAPVTSGPWAKRFGGTGTEMAQTVAVDGSGNIIVAGYFQGSADFGGGALTSVGGYDLVIAKYTAAGAHVWSKRFGGSGDELVKKVAVDASGNIVVTGCFTGTTDLGGGPLTSAGGMEIFIAKYSPTGAHLWSKRFGDIYDDCANGIAVDAGGNVLVTGYFSSSVDFGGGMIWAAYGGIDTFVVKLSPNGDHVWSKNFVTFAADYGTSVAVDPSGNVVVAGYFLGTQIDCGGGWLMNRGGSDAFIVKYAPDGTHLWSKNVGGATADQATAVTTDASGNVFLLGWFSNSGDFDGTVLSTVGGWDTFLVKFSPSGVRQWAKSFSSPGNYDFPRGLATDASGNVVITGEFTLTIDLGGGLLSSIINGTQSIFAAKYSPSGAHLWSKCFGGTSTEDSFGIATDAAGYVVMVGYFQGTANFDGQLLSGAGSTDQYLLRLDPSTGSSR